MGKGQRSKVIRLSRLLKPYRINRLAILLKPYRVTRPVPRPAVEKAKVPAQR